MFASVTRLRVKLARHLPAFLWNTFLTKQQVVHAPGFAGGRLLIDAHRTYWTLTVWETELAMKVFRGAGAHARVMPRLAEWCDEAAYTHWEVVDGAVPAWPEAYERLAREGKLSRVTNPSAAHTARIFAQPRLQPLIGADLKARR
jgi:hypothetical protein